MHPPIAGAVATLTLLFSLPGALFFAELSHYGGGTEITGMSIALFAVSLFEVLVIIYTDRLKAVRSVTFVSALSIIGYGVLSGKEEYAFIYISAFAVWLSGIAATVIIDIVQAAIKITKKSVKVRDILLTEEILYQNGMEVPDTDGMEEDEAMTVKMDNILKFLNEHRDFLPEDKKGMDLSEMIEYLEQEQKQSKKDSLTDREK